MFCDRSTTGGTYTADNWQTIQRSRLVQLSQSYPDILDARFTTCTQCTDNVESIMSSSLGQWWNGVPLPADAYFSNKVLLDIGGNSFSSRLYELLLTGAQVVKISEDNPCSEFWYSGLKDHVHYTMVDSQMHTLLQSVITSYHKPHQAARQAANAIGLVAHALNESAWMSYVVSVINQISTLQYHPSNQEYQQSLLKMKQVGAHNLSYCTIAPQQHCMC